MFLFTHTHTGDATAARCGSVAFWHPWGMGERGNSSMGAGRYKGGLFMASTLGGTCRLWDATLRESGLVGRLGDIEHLRHALCPPASFKCGCPSFDDSIPWPRLDYGKHCLRPVDITLPSFEPIGARVPCWTMQADELFWPRARWQ